MLTPTAKNRWHAFGIHLLISLVIFIAMCLIIVLFWYPGMLFATEGGWQGVRLIAGIDFVIGPTLTLIVYNKAKKELKYDLAIIGLLQAICITYGMYVVHNSRPAVIAYADGVFYTIPLLRFESRGLDISDFDLLNNKLPIKVNVGLPEDRHERTIFRAQRLLTGIEMSTDRYQHFDHALPLLTKEGFSIEHAKKVGLVIPDELQSDEYRVFRLQTRYDTHAVAVKVKTGEMVQLLGKVAFDQLELVPLSRE